MNETTTNVMYVDIKASNEGVDACAWAEMLARMYLRWGEKVDVGSTYLCHEPHDIAGIKSCTIKFSGGDLYNKLSSESGIHTLIRKSPFNADNKRYTCFSGVLVYPLDRENFSEKDYKIDIFSPSGCGGGIPHARPMVRVTHLPTKLFINVDVHRSQSPTKISAIDCLRSKVDALEKIEGQEPSRVRIYNLITGTVYKWNEEGKKLEWNNAQDVLDGNIDMFLNLKTKETER